MVLMTRRAEFSAAHYYHIPEWSEEENRRVFGKCANLEGHGHNYAIEVTVAGPVDARTGFVMDLQELKAAINECVVDPFDHRHLNKEIQEFTALTPTTENVARVAWDRLAPVINQHPTARLFRVRIYEHADLFADCYGDDESAEEQTSSQQPAAVLNRRYRFSASHRLHSDKLSDEQNRATYGKCNNPHGHGHNYVVEVQVSGPVDPTTGMIVNLGDLDAFAQREIVERFDEKNLNRDPWFQHEVPTSEALCRRIFEHAQRHFKLAVIDRVRVEETGQNIFEVLREGYLPA